LSYNYINQESSIEIVLRFEMADNVKDLDIDTIIDKLLEVRG
jgi:hypothetical protein